MTWKKEQIQEVPWDDYLLDPVDLGRLEYIRIYKNIPRHYKIINRYPENFRNEVVPFTLEVSLWGNSNRNFDKNPHSQFISILRGPISNAQARFFFKPASKERVIKYKEEKRILNSTVILKGL